MALHGHNGPCGRSSELECKSAVSHRPLTYPITQSSVLKVSCALTPAGRQACIILHTPKFGHSWVNVGGCTQAHTISYKWLPLFAQIWYILICYGMACLKMLNSRVCLRTMSLSRHRQIEMYIAQMSGNFQPCLLKDIVLKQTLRSHECYKLSG